MNLLFDCETDDASVRSPYTHAELNVVVKRPVKSLALRIPPWVAGKITVDDVSALRRDRGYLWIDHPPVGQSLRLVFDLPEQDIALKHRTRNIRARLRGDAPAAMENFGTPLTFFDPLDE